MMLAKAEDIVSIKYACIHDMISIITYKPMKAMSSFAEFEELIKQMRAQTQQYQIQVSMCHAQ